MNEKIICDICEKEISIDNIMIDDEEVICRSCWQEWEQEAKMLEAEYWRSRL